jgi:MinD-like ATPase involved in chromosome partitioning or flagellar assembly
VALAGVYAQRRVDGWPATTLLVDCDLGRGKVACHLRAQPGATLVSACALLTPIGEPCPPHHLQQPRRDGPWLLPGLARPEQWQDVAPSDLARLLGTLREHFPLLVVDLGAAVPPDPRGAGHLAVLGGADLILAVCAASPPRLEDFQIQFPTLANLLSPEQLACVRVVLNGAEPQELPRYRLEVKRTLGVQVIGHVPWDRAAIRRSLALRQPLVQGSPRSLAAQAVVYLADRLLAEVGSDMMRSQP